MLVGSELFIFSSQTIWLCAFLQCINTKSIAKEYAASIKSGHILNVLCECGCSDCFFHWIVCFIYNALKMVVCLLVSGGWNQSWSCAFLGRN